MSALRIILQPTDIVCDLCPKKLVKPITSASKAYVSASNSELDKGNSLKTSA